MASAYIEETAVGFVKETLSNIRVPSVEKANISSPLSRALLLIILVLSSTINLTKLDANIAPPYIKA